MKNKTTLATEKALFPANEQDAIKKVLYLINQSDKGALRKMPAKKFKECWYAIAFLYPGLHPDSAIDHGKRVSLKATLPARFAGQDQRLVAPFFVLSGWPLALAAASKEAWNRYEKGLLKDDEFYCSDATFAGIKFRTNRK